MFVDNNLDIIWKLLVQMIDGINLLIVTYIWDLIDDEVVSVNLIEFDLEAKPYKKLYWFLWNKTRLMEVAQISESLTNEYL